MTKTELVIVAWVGGALLGLIIGFWWGTIRTTLRLTPPDHAPRTPWGRCEGCGMVFDPYSAVPGYRDPSRHLPECEYAPTAR